MHRHESAFHDGLKFKRNKIFKTKVAKIRVLYHIMCLYKMIDERKPTIPRMMTAINFSMNLKIINLLNQGLKHNERN